MSESRHLEGGCLCGSVRYRFTGPLQSVNICHCTMCRRQTGAAAPTFVTIERDQLELTAGEPLAYRSSRRALRHYCRDCGTPLFWQPIGGTIVDVFWGTLDDPAQVPPPDDQIWTENRPAWVTLIGEIPGVARDRDEG